MREFVSFKYLEYNLINSNSNQIYSNSYYISSNSY